MGFRQANFERIRFERIWTLVAHGAAHDGRHVRLFGDNVTNRDYLTGAQDAPGYRGTHFGRAYPEASYELELGIKF